MSFTVEPMQQACMLAERRPKTSATGAVDDANQASMPFVPVGKSMTRERPPVPSDIMKSIEMSVSHSVFLCG